MGLVWFLGQNFPISVQWNKAHFILGNFDSMVTEDFSEENVLAETLGKTSVFWEKKPLAWEF